MPNAQLALRSGDWFLFFTYFLVVFAVAYGFGRKQKGGVAQYFMAGNSLPWFVVAGSMVVTSLSTEQIIGNNGAAYQYGFSVAQWDCWVLPWVTMLIWIFLPAYLRGRVVTIPDFLAQRYGEGLRDIFAMVSVISFTFLNMAVVLYTGVILLSSLFPIRLVVAGQDYTLFLWSAILVVSTLVYTTWGGLATVAWTDFMQFLVLCLASGLIFAFALRAIGGGSGIASLGHGWEILRQSQASRFHLIEPASHPLVPWPALFMRVVTTQLYYNCATQFILQRALAAKSDWDARFGSLVYASFGLLLPFIDVFPGMMAYHLNPHLDPNKAVPFLIHAVVPQGWGVRGLILAGMTAAIMSALSSLINSTSTIFVLDVYTKRIRPHATERHQLLVGRLACIVFMACAVAWTPMIGRYKLIFVYFQSFLAYVAAPAGAIFLLGVFWRRATQQAAIGAILTGLPFCIAIEVFRRSNPQFQVPFTHISLATLSFIYISFAGWILSMLVMVVVSLYGLPPNPTRIKAVMWDKSALAEPHPDGTAVRWYCRLWVWYAVFAAAWIAYCVYFR